MYTFIVGQNSYDTITKILSDVIYIQAGAPNTSFFIFVEPESVWFADVQRQSS